MIWPPEPTNGTYQPGAGALKVSLTVSGSTASTLSSSMYGPTFVDAVSLFMMNCQVKTTSSAVKGWPSAHLTSFFSLYVTLLPSSDSPPFCFDGTSAARIGTKPPLLSNVISGSQQMRDAWVS